MDTVMIDQLAVFARVGVSDPERRHPQRLLVTLRVERDLEAASRSDDLRDTTDYAALARDIVRLGAAREFRLVEAVAGAIADLVLARPGVHAVSVQVRKNALPEAAWVGVSLRRQQEPHA